MATTTEIQRTASVKWQGDIAKGRGDITTGSGKVEAMYSFDTRFAAAPGTNPEELLGASLAACFTMAFAAALTRSGNAPASIETTATVHLAHAGSSYTIAKIELQTKAGVSGVAEGDFQTMAKEAEKGCPIGKALSAVPVELTAVLA